MHVLEPGGIAKSCSRLGYLHVGIAVTSAVSAVARMADSTQTLRAWRRTCPSSTASRIASGPVSISR
jgi:hypothetical protein